MRAYLLLWSLVLHVISLYGRALSQLSRLKGSKPRNNIEVSLCFQAFRRAVNHDAERLALLLERAPACLVPGTGTLTALSYQRSDSALLTTSMSALVSAPFDAYLAQVH